MKIEQRRAGDAVVLSVDGDIRMLESGAFLLADKVRSVLQQGDKHLILDLGRVRFVDSGGLAELVHTEGIVRNQGGALKLLNVTRRLNDLLVVTRLLTVFDCFDEESEALASFEASDVAHELTV